MIMMMMIMMMMIMKNMFVNRYCNFRRQKVIMKKAENTLKYKDLMNSAHVKSKNKSDASSSRGS
jgi:hypothetical protein